MIPSVDACCLWLCSALVVMFGWWVAAGYGWLCMSGQVGWSPWML
jgi:hypothetical protein